MKFIKFIFEYVIITLVLISAIYKVNIISANLVEANWKKLFVEYTLKNDEG